MKKLLFLLIGFPSLGQSLSLPPIQAELLKDASAVVRNHETEFFVKDAGEGVIKVKGLITILDEKGSGHANLVIGYNKFSKVNNIEARIYDDSGVLVKKLKKDDIERFSTSTGQNSIDDSFVKVASLTYNKYPYTIEFEYQITSRNQMFYPSWEAVPDYAEHTSVEKSTFRVSMPSGLKLRYKEQNMPAGVRLEQIGNRTVYNWGISNFNAIEKETNAPRYTGIMPTVYTAPTDFKVDNYTGSVNSWEDIGKFYGSLNSNRDDVPAALADRIKELVKDTKNEEDKVKRIYQYVQENTRYVSIQLGIGGWQSMKASEVALKGYGDCKALTNFTKALLGVAGIRAHEALIIAGANRKDFSVDFPSFRFNHVILCVPMAKDTLWLECTSQDNPFAYLGSFTDDRYTILVTDDGGKLVKTPRYEYDENKLVRRVNLLLSENGEADAEIETDYYGLQYEQISGVLNSLNNEEQKKWFYKNLGLAGTDIIKFSLTEKRERLPSVNEKLRLHMKNAVTKSGKRLFLTPNMLNQYNRPSAINKSRVADLQLNDNYLDIDSVIVKIPDGYEVEFLPEPVTVGTVFGKYDSKVILRDRTIHYRREISIFAGLHKPSAYNEWVEFRKKIAKADRDQVVLIAR